eukprot:5061886-Pleurochrysis_carterae.AAC.2
MTAVPVANGSGTSAILEGKLCGTSVVNNNQTRRNAPAHERWMRTRPAVVCAMLQCSDAPRVGACETISPAETRMTPSSS